MKKLLLSFVILSLVASFVARMPSGVVQAAADKVKICHRTASHTNPYTAPEVDADSIDGDDGNDNGQGDHYVNHTGPVWYSGIQGEWGDIIPPVTGVHNGLNWTAQGQGFYNNNCNIPTVTPTPTPTVTPTPTPTVTPTPTPTATPVPGPGHESSAAIDPNPVCSGQNFDASMTLKRDGQPAAGVNVKFVYHGEAKYAVTEANGRAGVAFGYNDDSDVEFIPEGGFPSQKQRVGHKTDDCPVSVTPSNPQVLGASTMAKTGVVEDAMVNMVGLMGAGMTALGSFLYAKKRV